MVNEIALKPLRALDLMSPVQSTTGRPCSSFTGNSRASAKRTGDGSTLAAAFQRGVAPALACRERQHPIGADAGFENVFQGHAAVLAHREVRLDRHDEPLARLRGRLAFLEQSDQGMAISCT